jgi:hypothetical protein
MGRTLGPGKLSKLPDGTFRLDYRDPAGRQGVLIVKRRPLRFRPPDPPFRVRHPVAARRIAAAWLVYVLLFGLANLVQWYRCWAGHVQISDLGMVCFFIAGVSGVLVFFMLSLSRWRRETGASAPR